MLKITHRIIASLLFPQEEISKSRKKELEVLWCMIYELENSPHFRYWVLNKTLKVSESSNGQLHCGGMISIIATHIGLQIPNNPQDKNLGLDSLIHSCHGEYASFLLQVQRECSLDR